MGVGEALVGADITPPQASPDSATQSPVSEKEISASSSCKVIIKVKPFLNNKGQLDESLADERCITWDNGRPDDQAPPLKRLLFPDMDRAYMFDLVLAPTCTQKESYDSVCVGMIDSFLSGFNCCLLAYGQTGSGKTYTMGTAQPQGTTRSRKDDRGIVPRALSDLFLLVDDKRKQGWKIDLQVSYIELYNEEIRDLLDRGGSGAAAPTTRPSAGRPILGQGLFPSNLQGATPLQRAGIKITHDKNTNQIVLQGIKCVKVDSETEAVDCLSVGGLYRTTGSNTLNVTSSRSHAIYTITAVQTEMLKEYGEGATVTSKFHFVDLAGSERVKRTQAQGHRLREGININSGLLALSNVINALTEEKGLTASENTHVPYRDSKLTRILQDSLGGNSKTTMIACVSASKSDFAETFSTIKYASRARHIKNTPVLNKDPQSVLIASLKQRLADLEEQLKEARRRIPSLISLSDSTAHSTDAEKVIGDLEREIAGLREVIKVRETREAEERAKRIALEAKLLKYKEKYSTLVKKHGLQSAPESVKSGESDYEEIVSDEDNPHSTQEALARNSELESEIDMLRKELSFLQRTLEQQKKLWASIGGSANSDKLLKITKLLQTLSERYQGNSSVEKTSSEELVDSTRDKILALPTPLQDEYDMETLSRLLTVASDEERETLLAMIDTLDHTAEATENLKTKSERLTMNMKRTEDLLMIKEREARHWEQMASHLSVELQTVKQQLEEAKKTEASLKDQAVLAEEKEKLTDTILTQTPAPRKGGVTPRGMPVPESVRLYQKLTEETACTRNFEAQLKRVELKFELAQRKRTESRTEASNYELSLQQMRAEKAQLVKKQAEQERRHRLVMADKDKLIARLETDARRHGEEKAKTEQKLAVLTKKNEKLSSKNLELYKEKEGLSKRVMSLQTANSRIHRQNSVNVPGQSVLTQSALVRGGKTDSMGSRAGSVAGSVARPKSASLCVGDTVSEAAQDALHRYISMRLERDMEIQALSRKEKRARRLEQEIERLQIRVNMMETEAEQSSVKRRTIIIRQLTDFNDKIEALKTEKAIYENEISQLRDGVTGTHTGEQDTRLLTDVKCQIRTHPDAVLEAFIQIYSLVTHHLEHTRRDLRKKEQELQDVKKLHANVQLKMEGLLNNQARERLEVLYEANTDKLAFIEAAVGFDRSESASPTRRQSASSSEDNEAGALPSPTPLTEKNIESMHAQVLREKVYILMNEKYEAQKQIELLQKNLDMLQAEQEARPLPRHHFNARGGPGHSDTDGEGKLRKDLDFKRVMLVSNEKIKELNRGQRSQRRAYSSTPSTRSNNAVVSPQRSPLLKKSLVPVLPLHSRLGFQSSLEGRVIKTARPDVRIHKADSTVISLTKARRVAEEETTDGGVCRSPSNKGLVRNKNSFSGLFARWKSDATMPRLKSCDDTPPNIQRQMKVDTDTHRDDTHSRDDTHTRDDTQDPPRKRHKLIQPRDVNHLVQISEAHSDYIRSLCFNAPRSRPTRLVTGSHNEIKAFDINRLINKGTAKSANCFCWKEIEPPSSLTSTGSGIETPLSVNSLDALEENIVVAAVGTSVKILDLRCQKPVHSWIFAPPEDVGSGAFPLVNSVSVMADTTRDHVRYIAACGTDHTIRIFDPRHLGPMPLCRIPTRDEEYSVAYLPRLSHALADRKQGPEQNALNGIVCGGESGSVRLFARGFTQLPSLNNLGVVRQLKASEMVLNGTPVSALFCCSDRDDRLRSWIWDSTALRSTDIGDRRPPVVVGSRLRDHETLLAPLSSSSSSGDEDHWTLSNYGPSGKSLAALAVIEDDCEIVTGDKKGRLHLWKLTCEEQYDRTPKLHSPDVNRSRMRSASLSPHDQVRQPHVFLDPPQKAYTLTQVLLSSQPSHARQRPINGLLSLKGDDPRKRFIFSVADDTNIQIWNFASDPASFLQPPF